MRKIAITGTLSSGKSEVCRLIKSDLRGRVISADEIVHQLLSQDRNLIQQVIELLGQDVLENHQLSRSLIAKKVFNHPEKLLDLEDLIHPKVFAEIVKQADLAERENVSLFVVEIPLLFEKGWQSYFDKTVAVIADKDLRRERSSYKDFFDARSKNQLTDDEKAKLADSVIENNGTLAELKSQVLSVFS